MQASIDQYCLWELTSVVEHSEFVQDPIYKKKKYFFLIIRSLFLRILTLFLLVCQSVWNWKRVFWKRVHSTE